MKGSHTPVQLRFWWPLFWRFIYESIFKRVWKCSLKSKLNLQLTAQGEPAYSLRSSFWKGFLSLLLFCCLGSYDLILMILKPTPTWTVPRLHTDLDRHLRFVHLFMKVFFVLIVFCRDQFYPVLNLIIVTYISKQCRPTCTVPRLQTDMDRHLLLLFP